MRKLKIFLLAFLLLFVASPCVNAIERMEEEDWEGFELVGEKTKYYKTVTVYDNSVYQMNGFTDAVRNATSETVEITEEEYNSVDVNQLNTLQLMNSTTVETTYKEMVTSIYANDSSYRYKNILSWKNFPVVRSYDIIGIGFFSNVTPTKYYFNQYYCEYGDGDCGYLYMAYPSQFSSGMSVIFPLATSSILTSLRQTFYFDVAKTDPNSTLTYQYAYGDYSHATTTTGLVAAADHEVIQYAGIVLGSSISDNYDNIDVADVYYPCNW